MVVYSLNLYAHIQHMLTHQICSLIFFPCSSTVLILKSIPKEEKRSKHISASYESDTRVSTRVKTSGDNGFITLQSESDRTPFPPQTITWSLPDSAVSWPDQTRPDQGLFAGSGGIRSWPTISETQYIRGGSRENSKRAHVSKFSNKLKTKKLCVCVRECD